MDVIGYDIHSAGRLQSRRPCDIADVQAMLTAIADLSGYESQKGLTDSQLQLLGDLNGDGVVDNETFNR